MIRSGSARTLAWALGLFGALACAVAAGVAVAFGAPASFLAVYVVGILAGLLGALIASREPTNSIGWLMCATALSTSLIHLPVGYGYAALVIQHGAWPLGALAVWFGAWAWTLVIGPFLPPISVRFPDGKVRHPWRPVDWLAIGGTTLFALGIALDRPAGLQGFLPIPGTKVALLSPSLANPLGAALPEGLLGAVRIAGLSLILVAYVAAAASLSLRFRQARDDEKLQLKWFAYSAALIALAIVYAGVAWSFFGQPLYLALTPVDFAALTLPLAIGIAILRYRLYDIDLLINRTLVYGGATAILGALYAAVVTFLQRLFISLSGSKSDAAYVLTAFAVVVAFSPVKDWLQRQVDRRIGRRSPSAVLDEFRADVDAVVSVIDVNRVACRLLDQAVLAFDVRGAALYMRSEKTPIYSRGRMNGGAAIDVPLRHEGRPLGRLVLGSRRGNLTYTTRDRDTLQRSADSVGEALALAQHLGHWPLTTPHITKEE